MTCQPIEFPRWKLTLPVGKPGDPDEIVRPVASVKPWYRRVGDDLILRAHAGGVTTPNSKYPRCELRELVPETLKPASWTNGYGVHTLTMTARVLDLTPVKPHVVVAQIHDGSDDVAMIRLERRHLFVEADGEVVKTLDADYVLGAPFTTELRATADGIQVLYVRHGQTKTRAAHVGGRFIGAYFKAGCYLQSNVAKGDRPESFAEVAIRSLRVQHWTAA